MNTAIIYKVKNGSPVIVYGAGSLGQSVAKWCEQNDIPYVFMCKNFDEVDNSISISELDNYNDSKIIVSSDIYEDEMMEILRSKEIKEERIISYKEIISDLEITWKTLEAYARWDIMDERAKVIAGYITEDIKSVVDYGSGKEFIFNYLPSDTEYYPIDYTKRSDKTIVCDLNEGVFPEIFGDASLCIGVIEYIKPYGKLFNHIFSHTNKMAIIGYRTFESMPNIIDKRAHALVNCLTEGDLIEFANNYGFNLKNRFIYRFNEISSLPIFIFVCKQK